MWFFFKITKNNLQSFRLFHLLTTHLKPLRLVTFAYHLKMLEVAYHMLHLIMERATEWWETPSPLWILEYLQVLQKVFNNIVAIACLIYTLLKSVNHLPLLEACTAPFVTLWASSPNLATPPSLDQLETSSSDESVPIHLQNYPHKWWKYLHACVCVS